MTKSNLEETPPRTWGRPLRDADLYGYVGNTPTHVGKTFFEAGADLFDEKHPHARGEDERLIAALEEKKETPPRTWGRQNRRLSE